MRIQSVGVIGAGVMGRGVSQVLAQTGHDVILLDISQDTLEHAKDEIRNNVRLQSLFGKRDATQTPEEVLERIVFCTGNQHLADVDFDRERDREIAAQEGGLHPFVEIGNDVFIRGGSFVGHNAILKDHCFLAGGVVVLGHAVVEPYCLLGANSTVRNNVTIGSECVIGAGAVILQDTQERQVYVSRSADLLPVPSDQLNLR